MRLVRGLFRGLFWTWLTMRENKNDGWGVLEVKSVVVGRVPRLGS